MTYRLTERRQEIAKKQQSVAYLPPGEGESLRLFDRTICTFKSRGGSYTLFESAAPPGSGPPPHIHHTQDEVIYVLEGHYAFTSGDKTLKLGPGSLVSIPKGTVHTLKVSGREPGRCLMLLTPPGPLERFLEEVGVPTDKDQASLAPQDGHSDMERVLESARRNGIELLVTPV